jgi:hypothetical protein
MQETGMIAAYAEALASKLGFDLALSRRVRHEVEDHLWEAAVAGPQENRGKAVEQAIARFGDVRAIAAKFATVWLIKQMQKVGITVILVVAGVLVAMKARVAWYAATQWVLSEDLRAAAHLVGVLDACAFWLSAIAGIAAWIYLILGRASPTNSYASQYRHLRRVLLLCFVSAAALVVSVVGDGVLTALRLAGRGLSAEFLIPIVSMFIEIVCAGILISSLRSITIGMAHTSALLET